MEVQGREQRANNTVCVATTYLQAIVWGEGVGAVQVPGAGGVAQVLQVKVHALITVLGARCGESVIDTGVHTAHNSD